MFTIQAQGAQVKAMFKTVCPGKCNFYLKGIPVKAMLTTGCSVKGNVHYRVFVKGNLYLVKVLRSALFVVHKNLFLSTYCFHFEKNIHFLFKIESSSPMEIVGESLFSSEKIYNLHGFPF